MNRIYLRLLIGIKFPVAKSYNILSKNNYGADALIKKNGYQCLDFTQIFDDPCLFKDQDHLNETGTKKFLEILF